MNPCPRCGASLSGERCSACGYGHGSLAGADGSDGGLRADLDRMLMSAVLPDVDRSLMLDLAASSMPPSLALLDEPTRGALAKVEDAPMDLARILDGEIELGLAQIESLGLGELGLTGAEDKKLIRTGLALLRARRYSEAREWWSLNRTEAAAGSDRALLLAIMELFTCRLAGDEGGARAARGVVEAEMKARRGGV
jgi:hypothetical protein